MSAGNVKFTGRLAALGALEAGDLPSGDAALFSADVENLRALASTFNKTTTFHAGPLADAGADLLAALKDAVNWPTANNNRHGTHTKAGVCDCWISSAMAAIAKAEGRE